MLRAFRRLSLLVALTAALLLPSVPAHADPGPPPSSMSSLGDSITRAFNACGWYYDCTSRSWSTGSYSTVNSHYRRILAKNSAISGRNYNDARSGARASDMYGQAGTAASRGVQYVTMLIGANDACTSSESTMTPVTTYRSQINSALSRLKSGLPNAKVYIVSVPDIKRLWAIGKNNSSARYAWSQFNICQSMLANPTSTHPDDEARRNRVRQRVIDYNAQLAQACVAYGANCKFDNNAIFNYPFVLSQVSSWDYFHPNTEGQRVLAQVSYGAGFGW
ncbi:MAG: SGNH/GDSL hydrolase family protein [Micromonosporaceae bacterium]|nr:SGNH/GDSL hydrolase family protein [Micromonosporaceae bacterium]